MNSEDPLICKLPQKPWILDGAHRRPSRIIKSLLLDTSIEEEHNWKLERKHETIVREITRAETYQTSDSSLVVIAYGTAARIAKGAIKKVREMGLKVGLIRPITLWPFPQRVLKESSGRVKDFLVFEMSTGQMLEDVKLSLEGRSRIYFHGRPGGVVSTPLDIKKVITDCFKQNGLD